MKEPIWITTNEAIDEVEKLTGKRITLPTLINWINKYNFGHKLAGRYEIDKNKLVDYVKGVRKDG